MTIVNLALSGILLFLSLLHVYWLLTGTSGLSAVIPEVDGKPAFVPGRPATAAVAVLLLVASGLCAAQAELFEMSASPLSRAGVWVLMVVFLLRGLGDFRWVGVFKRVRGTRFARLDSWVYSPLCLGISLLCGLLLATGTSDPLN